MPKIEKDRSKTGKNRSKAVQSGLWRVWDIYKPVSVSVLLKIGKKPDQTGLSNTRKSGSSSWLRDLFQDESSFGNLSEQGKPKFENKLQSR